MTPGDFLNLIRETYDQPQQMARRVIGLGLSAQEAIMALALAAVLTTIVTVIPAMIQPLPDPVFFALLANPIALSALQLGAFILCAVLMAKIGGRFGGKGTVPQAMAVLAWIQLVLVALQVVQVVLGLLIPILALPVALFSIFSFFFLLSRFTAELHGFRSVGMVLFFIIVTMIGLAILLGLVLVPLLPVPNV